MEPIVSIENASFRFAGPARPARGFKDVSFSLFPGEFLSVIGPSGAGKSTLLRAIAGVIQETKGRIVRNFKKPAMVFQGHGIFPWQTVLENAAFGLAMEAVPARERERRAREKLNEVGLSGLEERYPNELSGGQRQRVAVARALAVEPDLLLMDEPLASLDSLTAASLKKDVLELWKRYHMAVVLVSHLIPDAVELSDRIVIFKSDGSVQKITPVELPRPRDARSQEFFTEVDALTKALSMP